MGNLRTLGLREYIKSVDLFYSACCWSSQQSMQQAIRAHVQQGLRPLHGWLYLSRGLLLLFASECFFQHRNQTQNTITINSVHTLRRSNAGDRRLWARLDWAAVLTHSPIPHHSDRAGLWSVYRYTRYHAATARDNAALLYCVAYVISRVVVLFRSGVVAFATIQ